MDSYYVAPVIENICRTSNGEYYLYDKATKCLFLVRSLWEPLVFLKRIDGHEEGFEFTGHEIFLIGEEIFITSQNSAKIAKYDMTTGRINYHDLISNGGDNGQLYNHVYFNNLIYYLPVVNTNEILIFNPQTEKVEIRNLENPWCGRHSFISQDNNRIIATEEGTNCYHLLDLNDFSDLYLSAPIHDELESTCFIDGYYYSTLQHSGRILQFDSKGNYRYFGKKENRVEEPFSNMLTIGSYLIAFPRKDTNILFLNVKDKACIYKKLPGVEKISLPQNEASNCFGYFLQGDKLYLLPWKYPYVCEIDLHTLETSAIQLETDAISFHKMYNVNFFDESKEIELRSFINYFVI